MLEVQATLGTTLAETTQAKDMGENGMKKLDWTAIRNAPPPCHVIGRPLNTCAQRLYEQQIRGNIDLTGEFWPGWRIRGQWLIGPGGLRFNARSLRAIAAMTGYGKTRSEPMIALATDSPAVL
jgi:hypothetical protein